MSDVNTAAVQEDDDDWSAEPPMLDGTREHPLFEKICEALQEVYDPEIPVDIFKLGLIYRIDIGPEGDVAVTMTLTSPGCPVAGEMPAWVEEALQPISGVKSTDVDIVWDPPWHPGFMSDMAKLELGMF